MTRKLTKGVTNILTGSPVNGTYRVHTSLTVFVSIDLSPPQIPQFWGTLKEFYFLVPPELGARGQLTVDLTRFYDLCVHGRSMALVIICQYYHWGTILKTVPETLAVAT